MAKALTQKTIENLKPSAKRREIADGAGLYFVLQPSGKTSWAYRYRTRGKNRKLTIGPYPKISLAEARRLAIRAMSQDDPAGAKKAARQAALAPVDVNTIDAALALFLAKYEKGRRRPNTIKQATRILIKEVLPALKGRLIADVKRRDVRELIEKIETRAPVLANRTLAIMRPFFAWCVDQEIVESNPCADIRAPAVETPRDRALNDDEIKALWPATGALSWPFRDSIRLLLLMGARLNEVAGMTWDEVDLDARLWRLPRERSKNKQAHGVPLSEMAIDILAALPRIQSQGNFVFTSTGDQPLKNFTPSKNKLDSRMPNVSHWTFHDLRRTCASGLARLGIAPHVIEACLNHRSGVISGIAATYNRHSYEPEKRAALDAWAQYVKALVSGEPARNVVNIKARG